MLPYSSSNIPQQAQGHHRRQDSIPTDFDDLKISTPPRQAIHHRGLSFDQRIPTHGLPQFQEEPTPNTNHKHMQHAIPEPQPRPMARPGQRRNNSDEGTLRPNSFAAQTDSGPGGLRNDLSLAHIDEMTDQELLAFMSRRRQQNNNRHSYCSGISAGSLDGTGLEITSVAETSQQDNAGKAPMTGGTEPSKRSSVQYLTLKPQRPCTPPAQSNCCENETSIYFQE